MTEQEAQTAMVELRRAAMKVLLREKPTQAQLEAIIIELDKKLESLLADIKEVAS